MRRTIYTQGGRRLDIEIPVGQPDLYDVIVAAGIPLDHHESDLYVPDTPEVRAILDRPEYALNKTNATRFTNQVEGGTWIDIPFAYAPYWRARSTGKAVRAQATGRPTTHTGRAKRADD